MTDNAHPGGDAPWLEAGKRPFHTAHQPLPQTRGDFCYWAASNLAGNLLRACLAEFLVRASLGQRG